jgi:hypothetical protein
MPLSNAAETDLLKLIFTNIAFANVGNAGGLQPSTVAGNLYVALHTASPGEAGDQTTNEATYTNYARVAVARSAGGWTVAGDQVSNTALVAFPQCGATPNTILFWSVGLASAGASEILDYGPVAPLIMEAFTALTTDVITSPNMAFAVDDRVTFFAREGGALPGGIVEGTVYFIKTAAAPAYTISATSGGATIDITTDGAGFIQKVTPLAVANLVTPQFAAGSLVVTLG